MKFDTKELEIHNHVRCTDEELNEAALAVENAVLQRFGSLVDLQAAIDLLGKEAGVSFIPVINVSGCKNLVDILNEVHPLIDQALRHRKIEAFHKSLEKSLPPKDFYIKRRKVGQVEDD